MISIENSITLTLWKKNILDDLPFNNSDFPYVTLVFPEGYLPLFHRFPPGRLPRAVTAYPGFEDFCDAVQVDPVKTSGEAWQAVSDECKAWGMLGMGLS